MEIPDKLYLSEDGIVELLKEISIYNEEFSLDLNPQIGELDRKLYKCRCYCDFKGAPIKRNNLRIYTDIKTLSKKYQTVCNNYLKLSKDHFVLTMEKHQTLIRQVILDYQLSTQTLQQLTEHFPTIKKELTSGKEFNWNELKKATSKLVPEMDITQFLKYGYRYSDKPGYQRIKLRLDSEDYAVKNKMTVFNGILLFNY